MGRVRARAPPYPERLGGGRLSARGVKSRAVATFSVRFLGCKVSHVDAQEIRERLLADGHSELDDAADVAVVNTCCVTHEAVRKSRHAASRAARTHRHVYVTGCGASLSTDGFAGLPENVVVVARRSEDTPTVVARDVGAIGCVHADARLDRVRAFVRVQDGCTFSCAFCVIPQVRGASRSRAADAVLREVRRRVGHGHREIVLTGINLGCYRVLRAMGRRYAPATYLRRLERFGDFNLTTDAIVGFPGEDEGAFRRTLAVVGAAGITKVHVFPYSPRPGTATAAADTVAAEVKRERGARLREASLVASLARWREKLGREDVVLVDRPGRGYGDDYSPWLVEGMVGELVRVRGAEVTEEGIRAA